MWAKRGKMLAPLLRKKECGEMKTTSWDSIPQRAFDNVNGPSRNSTGLSRLHEALMIYTSPPLKQLGVVITQDNKPIAYFSWNSPARNQ
jgi:hypothetical protein